MVAEDDRLRLARLAADVVAEAAGVEPSPDEAWRTEDPDGDPIAGVLVMASGAGAIEVEVHLDVAWPPERTDETTERVRAAIGERAAVEGLAERLGRVQILVHQVLPPSVA